MSPEIWQAIIAAIGVIISAAIPFIFRRYQDEPAGVMSHDEFISYAKRIPTTIRAWARVEKAAAELIESTCIDRILPLTSVNGVRDSTHATVHREWREPPWTQEYEYEDVPLDSDYNDRLYRASRDGHHHFKTEEAPNTVIGRFYEMEAVVSSVWVMVAKLENDHTGQVAYFYFSASTHSYEEICADTIRQIYNLKAEMLRALEGAGWVSI